MITTKGQRIKQVIKEKKLTQKSVAVALDITERYLTEIIKGTAPNVSPRIYDSFCLRYDVSLEWLDTGKGPKYSVDDKILKTVNIPVLARCPAGFPDEVSDDGVIEYLALPDVPPKTYAIIVVGDSMSPAIRDGEYALFVRADEIHDGDVVIAKNEWNECMVKRYRVRDGKALLSSDNPQYPTVEPNEHYKIIGKVIEIVSRRRRF
jgi:SOS-response transcriptional repressor LexA